MSEMTDERAAEVLAAHNEWRRFNGETGVPGAPVMGNPAEIGRAIDHAIASLSAQQHPAETPVCTGDEIRCHDGHGCECAMREKQPPAEAQAAPPSAPVGVEGHVKALRELRDTGDVSDWRLFESALDAAIAALAQQPATDVGEEIMVNAAHDVYTLPLQPSGLSSGPRFVVHVPGPEAQAQGGGEVVDEGSRSVTRQLLHWGGVPVHVTGTVTTSPGNWSLIDAALAAQQGGGAS